MDDEHPIPLAAPRPSLAIVVPCFNEEDVLPETARRLDALLGRLIDQGRIAADSHVCFIDDGSKDRTWAIIGELRQGLRRCGGIKLSRNRGHQNALMAGLLSVPGDVIVSVDADLQDDLEAIGAMLAAAAAGSDIVYGMRSARAADKPMKRMTARAYYRLLRALGVEIIFDHADFRLMTRRAVEALREYEESNLFLRALIPQLGFDTAIVTYDRAERFAGTSKYPVRKMLAFALEGITSFSTRPLRMVTLLGLLISLLALALTIWASFAALVLEITIPGWASTVIPIYLICGVQLFCVGVIGEYVGKIYLETKRRPRFHVAATLPPRVPTGSPPSAEPSAERPDARVGDSAARLRPPPAHGANGLAEQRAHDDAKSEPAETPPESRMSADISWFHSIDLGDEITPGVAPLSYFQDYADKVLPDVRGKSVLDIGAWNGFYAFEAEKRGAADVLATDHFCWSGPGWGTRDGFDYAHKKLGSRVRATEVDVFDLDPAKLGQFDVVLFLGVFYHLQDPLGGLRKAAAMSRDEIVVETASDLPDIAEPVLRFYPSGELNGDPTNVFAPNRACLEAMLRDLGFREMRSRLTSAEPRARLIVHAKR